MTQQYVETRTHPFSLKRAVSGYAVSVVVGLVVTIWRVMAESGDELAEADVEITLGPYLWGMTATLLVQLLWVGWITLDHASPHQTLGLRMTAEDLLIGVGLLALVVAGRFVITEILFPVFTDIDSGLEESAFPFSEIPESQILWLIAIVGLMVPVVEEIYFRGVLLQALDHRFGLLAAVIGSSVLFGVLHLGSFSAAGLVPVVAATWAGLLFALTAAYTGRLGAAIVAHALNNTLVMVLVSSAS